LETVEIDKILCFSDLFLLPSITESFGLAALEAMASGVPVISSNTGGIPEVNIDGVSGYLSDVGDIESMSKNAIHILSNNEILKQFKLNAIKESKKFDIHNVVPQYEAIYERTLKKCMVLK
jgi:L-malate glycosyltransferase